VFRLAMLSCLFLSGARRRVEETHRVSRRAPTRPCRFCRRALQVVGFCGPLSGAKNGG